MKDELLKALRCFKYVEVREAHKTPFFAREEAPDWLQKFIPPEDPWNPDSWPVSLAWAALQALIELPKEPREPLVYYVERVADKMMLYFTPRAALKWAVSSEKRLALAEEALRRGASSIQEAARTGLRWAAFDTALGIFMELAGERLCEL